MLRRRSQLVSGRLCSSYVQGQSPEPRIREYFYFIDHLGQLFLDDARMKNFTSCFKDRKFLDFFFKRLRRNEIQRYNPAFPWISYCGRERNFVRVDDTPLVLTELLLDQPEPRMRLADGGPGLIFPFDPSRLAMRPDNGRLYIESPRKREWGPSVLVRSAIADGLHPDFVWADGDAAPPTALRWRGEDVRLDWKMEY